MAQRRMLSKRVVQTQRFLRLPLETQALYFHLVLNADDDGVIEAFPVVRMIGASDDSLGLLVIKQFIKPLNDEMVYFIVDFQEQNKIRKDRYQESKYKDLLAVNQTATIVQPNGNQMEPQDRLGKDRLGKDKNTLSGKPDSASPKFDYKSVIDYLNSKAGTAYRSNGKKTQQLINARVADGFVIDDFKRVIDTKVAEWANSDMAKFLRPETLFGTKFESYLNQQVIRGKVQQDDGLDLPF
jgi:uncharacterized phage protein (TIGR02220 family)